MVWRGDSLWIGDAGNARIDAFDADGALIRSVPITPVADYEPGPEETFVGAQRTGGPGGRYQIVLLRRSVIANAVDTLYQVFSTPPADPLILSALTERPYAALSPDGDDWCATGSAPVAGAVSADCYRLSTSSHSTISAQVGVDKTSGRVWDSAVASFARNTNHTPQDIAALFHRPTDLPPVQGLKTANDGALWVQRWNDQSGRIRWDRISTTGSVARLIVPDSVTVLSALSIDEYYAAAADHDGIQSLVRCSIR